MTVFPLHHATPRSRDQAQAVRARLALGVLLLGLALCAVGYATGLLLLVRAVVRLV